MLDLLLHSTAGRRIFNPAQRLQAMLDFEAALGWALDGLGVIPGSVAQSIEHCCRAEFFDLEALAKDAAMAGNLAIPMVKQLTALVREHAPLAAGWVHWGATSQDVIDTGLVLQLRAELLLLERELDRVCEVLAELAMEHRATAMAGRTWLQQAVPITFGLKAAGWLDAMLRHRQRLDEIRERALVLQFGGAAGTLASLGQRGLEIGRALAEGLHLQLPAVPWHAHRDRVAEVATFHGLLVGTLGKMARDLSLLMQTELGEASELGIEGQGGSSSMPQKRNSVAAAAVLSSSIRVPGLVGTMLSAMVQEHERGLGGWHAEWETLPEICTLTLGALEKLTLLLEGLQICSSAMEANLGRTQGLLLAEAVSMELAKSAGKEQAHSMMEAAARRAIETGTPLRAVIEADRSLMRHLNAGLLDELFNPSAYLGSTDQMIDRVLHAYHQQSAAWKGLSLA